MTCLHPSPLPVGNIRRGRDGPYDPPPAQIPACGFPAPGSCRRSNATKVESLDGPAASVRRLAASGTCRFRLCVRGMRRGSPSLRPAAFPPPSPPPIHDRLCSRLPRYYAAVRLLRPACAASPDRASHPGPRPPTWSWAARGLPGSDVFRSSVMWSSTPAERRRLAWQRRTCCLQRFQPPWPLRDQAFRSSIHTPRDCCVRFVIVVADDHATLATGRRATVLPGPDFHRLDHASFAWRTGKCHLASGRWPRRSSPSSSASVSSRPWLAEVQPPAHTRNS